MKISEVARRSDVPASTLRFYETVGLLRAGRTAAGYREYGDETLDRLEVIRRAKSLGMHLDDIAELLDAWAAGSCAETKSTLRPRLATRLSDTLAEVASLQSRAAAVRQALAHVDTLPDSDDPCGPDCVVPVAADPPIACSLTGGETAERIAQWRELLADAPRVRMPNGVRVTVPAERAAELARLAAAEQACCPFFGLDLHFDGPAIHLDVRAPDTADDLLAEVFAPAG